MNRFAATTFALLTLSGAGAAWADDPTVTEPVARTSVVSRAEVRAAALQARAEGHNLGGETAYVQLPAGQPISRAQVLAETLEAIRLGAIEQGEQSRLLTPAQLERIRLAGQRTMATTTAGL